MGHDSVLWDRLACFSSPPIPCRELVLLVHLGDEGIAQEVVFLKLWSVDNLWLAENFLCSVFLFPQADLQLMLCIWILN